MRGTGRVHPEKNFFYFFVTYDRKIFGIGARPIFFRSGPDFFSLLDFGVYGLASPFFSEFRNPFFSRQICQIPATAAPRLLDSNFAKDSPDRFFVHIQDCC